ncbi:YHYH domain-containing protein [Bacillus sp. FJAT-29953]|nr:YHYH domain-containing protein [Bacillus sp. FJAT-29953]
MRKKIILLTLSFIFLFGSFVSAHSGRTDSNGGHNCSEKSKAKGLCTGYHYHNGGGSSSTGSSSGSGSVNINDKDCSDFASYDEVVAYWNSKGYSATYDPENLDGWGNGKVDDGIPCEAPSGYDLTKINNSPQQNQYQQDQKDMANGEQQGYQQGVNDGYQELANNSAASSGSEAFKNGYATGYNKGFEEGNQKITLEKENARNAGYSLGQKQDNIEIPALYSSHTGLKSAFEDGFNKAVNERVEQKKQEYSVLGYDDGKKDVHSTPQDVEEIYIKAYEDGYKKAQQELKDEYIKQGYEAAFTMISYKKPNLTNDKFVQWYKEGFASNKEVQKIKEAALSLGKNGEDLKIPTSSSKGEKIFKYYYQKGLKEYEEKQSTNQKAAAGGLGIVTLAWLGRRFFVAKKMIS